MELVNDLKINDGSPLVGHDRQDQHQEGYSMFSFMTMSCMGVSILDRVRDYIQKRRQLKDQAMISHYQQQYADRAVTLDEMFAICEDKIVRLQRSALECRKKDPTLAKRYLRDMLITKHQKDNIMNLKDRVDIIWNKISALKNMKIIAGQLDVARRVLSKMNQGLDVSGIDKLQDGLQNETDLFDEISDAFKSITISDEYAIQDDELENAFQNLSEDVELPEPIESSKKESKEEIMPEYKNKSEDKDSSKVNSTNERKKSTVRSRDNNNVLSEIL